MSGRTMSHQPILRNAVLSERRRSLRSQEPQSTGMPSEPRPPAAAPVDEAARAKGFAEGLQQGLAEASARIAREIDAHRRHLAAQSQQAEEKRVAEYHRRLATLDGVARALSQAAEQQSDQMQAAAVTLAFEALCRILGPDSGREAVLAGIVRHGFAQRRGHAPVRLRMHPQDLAELQSTAEGQALVRRHPATQWLGDAALQRGACLLDTEAGSVDAGLFTQLTRLREIWGATEGEA